MSAKSEFSVIGLAHKVCLSAEEQGYTPELLNALAEHPTLFRDTLRVQRGCAEVKEIEYVIDCDAPPFVPEGWTMEEHRKGGLFKLEPGKIDTQIKLHLSAAQRDGKVIKGTKLREELKDKPVLNANVLDYLLEHQELIPDDWKKDEKGNSRYIFFWGTIYRDSDGDPSVRCLYWRGVVWHWYWLEHVWREIYPAALRASSSV